MYRIRCRDSWKIHKEWNWISGNYCEILLFPRESRALTTTSKHQWNTLVDFFQAFLNMAKNTNRNNMFSLTNVAGAVFGGAPGILIMSLQRCTSRRLGGKFPLPDPLSQSQRCPWCRQCPRQCPRGCRCHLLCWEARGFLSVAMALKWWQDAVCWDFSTMASWPVGILRDEKPGCVDLSLADENLWK